MTYVVSALLAALGCNLLAIVAKPLNLGLLGNTLAGLGMGCVGVGLGRLAGLTYLPTLVFSLLLALVTMSVVGAFFNMRSR